MKYIVVLGDGMADVRKGPLGFKTPLDVAKKPNIDALAKQGTVGQIRTVDKGLLPGSDVANLSIIGYDPTTYYTGRSPLEALSIGVPMTETDWVFRMNLVTLTKEKNAPYENSVMKDYSAGDISTEEADKLVKVLIAAKITDKLKFYTGTGYRHCAVYGSREKLSNEVNLTPPHDILDKPIAAYLPTPSAQSDGGTANLLLSVMKESADILKYHPVNIKRIKEGKNPANSVWFWGAGTRPNLEPFNSKYGLRGAMISAVDLLKGIAKAAGMDIIDVEGATGNLNTNFRGKAEACLNALKTHDFVYVHIEAPDECGHQGNAQNKILAIEKVDEVVGIIVDNLRKEGEDFCIAVLPDHATPLYLKTHTSNPVPYLVYNSARPANSELIFNEEESQKGLYLNNGRSLIKLMLKS